MTNLQTAIIILSGHYLAAKIEGREMSTQIEQSIEQHKNGSYTTTVIKENKIYICNNCRNKEDEMGVEK